MGPRRVPWRSKPSSPPPPEKTDPDKVKIDDQLATVVRHLQDDRWFAAQAPLADNVETTGHLAPAYPWLTYWISRFDPAPEVVVRWLQVVLGTLTVLCYFFFARRAFQSTVAAALAGLLLAVHPFWIINTAELDDGVLTSFLLAAALLLGTRASQLGGAFASLIFGLTLAGLSMTRASLLPFALVALVWFLFRCRTIKLGWFCGLLAFLGFANGLAPWTVRNYQVFGEPVPIVTSTYLHFYMGNNSRATGGPLDEKTLRATLTQEQQQALLEEPNQAKRYAKLGRLALAHMENDPGAALGRRLSAGLDFTLGEAWFEPGQRLADQHPADPETDDWFMDNAQTILRGSLLAMLILGALGWRFTAGWRRQARLATLAVVWAPLPYLLGHADTFSGPRLPLDGILLCFAAFAVACLFPGTTRSPAKAISK